VLIALDTMYILQQPWVVFLEKWEKTERTAKTMGKKMMLTTGLQVGGYAKQNSRRVSATLSLTG